MITTSLNRLATSALAALIGLSPMAAAPALSQSNQRTIDITRPGEIKAPGLRNIIPIDMRAKGCTYKLDRRGKRETIRRVINAIAPGSEGAPLYVYEERNFDPKGAVKLLAVTCDNDRISVCGMTIFKHRNFLGPRFVVREGNVLFTSFQIWHQDARSYHITCQRRT